MTGSDAETASITDRLREAGCLDPEAEAEELLAAAPDAGVLEGWIARRTRGEPLAWITGATRFCGRTIRVEPGVYVPRPQTEELARRAAALLASNGRAVDLCTGSGAVAAHLIAEVPTASVVGVEIDARAVRCARGNGVPTVLGDLDGALRPGSFNVVTAVAPYVPTDQLRLLPTDVQRHEPRRAIDGGEDGLDEVRRVVAAAGRLLEPGGWLLVEVGHHQDRALEATLAAEGFEPATTWFDEEGDLRGLSAHRSG
jgi:release factor glutamine methyltransferase